MPPTDSRLVRVPMYREIVEDIFTGNLSPEDTLPEGAEFVRAYEDVGKMEFVFVFRHDSFAEVPEGEEIPRFEPEYTEQRAVESDEVTTLLCQIEENTRVMIDRLENS